MDTSTIPQANRVENPPASPRFIFAGTLSRDFFILPSGRTLLDQPGGNVLYAAVGLAMWEPDPPPGLIARVGEDYPYEWVEAMQRRGLDTRGIRVLPEAMDVRAFAVYGEGGIRSQEDPVAHFARLGQPFPKTLLGYQGPHQNQNSRTRLMPNSLRQGDIFPEFLDATAAHLCPVDYLTHSLLPAVLRQSGFTTLTLDPASGYMNPIFWDDVPALLTGLTAFLPALEEVKALFYGRSSNVWEMAEALAAYGCELIVMKCGENGQYLYDSASRARWEIPAYPTRVADLTGAGDAFCGGFMAGFRRTYDPLLAVMHGNVSASMTIEGSGAFYPLDALPSLAKARLEALKEYVRKV